ncbi:type III pantothenate kinase [bacterium]|nr:type III pantothenate kinase [bacterium]MBU3955313.1 type III pantothenate kinase [bacterium]
MKTLLIDIGNTFLKTAAIQNGKPIEGKIFQTSSIRGIKSVLVSKNISLCVCCSVVPDATAKLKKLCRELGIKIYFLTHRDIAGMKLKYNSPEDIGSDRIASIMGAGTHCPPPFIIVDLGSAVTCELVDKNGVYRGGVIFPGIELSLKALRAGTALLPEVKFSRPRKGPGASTPECIKKGVWAAVSGGIEKTVSCFLAREPCAKVFLTGAGARFFRKGDFPFRYRKESALVFNGLLQFYKKNV